MWSGALDSCNVLLSYSIILLASPITIILISTLFKHINIHNQAGGKGFESDKAYENVSIHWMDMENIHSVRSSMEMVEDACSSAKGYLGLLNNSAWLKHIRRIITAAVKVVHLMSIEEMSVMIHCRYV